MDLSEGNGLQKMNSQKISVSDHNLNIDKQSDSFIVDLESFSNEFEKDPTVTSNTTNSRINMQRSLSRKGNHRDILAPSSSPRVSMPEKPLCPPTLQMGTQDHSSNNHQQPPQHQITIKTGGVSTIADGRWIKRSSFKRSSHSWFTDPKRVVLFFATLSSMGTILLIFFTLTMRKPNEEEGILDWH